MDMLKFSDTRSSGFYFSVLLQKKSNYLFPVQTDKHFPVFGRFSIYVWSFQVVTFKLSFGISILIDVTLGTIVFLYAQKKMQTETPEKKSKAHTESEKQ